MADDAAYKKIIREMQLEPLTYREIAEDWEAKPDEWYHAIIAIGDLPVVLAIPNLKIVGVGVSLWLIMNLKLTIISMDWCKFHHNHTTLNFLMTS